MIYSVEDDQSIRDLVLYALRQSGYEAEGFAEGQSFREAMQRQLPELVLLDQMLPGVDGETLLLEMRRNPRTANIPVIMLTAKGSEMDKVRSLDSGADDYIVKPFGVMELLSRIKAVLRRAAPPEELRRLEIEGLMMDLDRHIVTSDGENVTLTNKEFELLKCLMQNPQIVFTREKLLDLVWDISYYGDTRTVDAHIRSLRQKLKANATLIGTVRGVGYRLDVEQQ
ncbi:MAG: response regulator transcription factor [Clostridiales bacterium]|nr:response regulator transcription factor [Clostridiales bacterium]